MKREYLLSLTNRYHNHYCQGNANMHHQIVTGSWTLSRQLWINVSFYCFDKSIIKVTDIDRGLISSPVCKYCVLISRGGRVTRRPPLSRSPRCIPDPCTLPSWSRCHRPVEENIQHLFNVQTYCCNTVPAGTSAHHPRSFVQAWILSMKSQAWIQTLMNPSNHV